MNNPPKKMLYDLMARTDNTKPVFIIGGGNSVNDALEFKDQLSQHYIITTNNAYKLFPKALISHFGDLRWWEINYRDITMVRNGLPITTCDNLGYYNFENFQEVTWFKKNGLTPPRELDTLCGNNAGHQAINLAYLLGFKNVILIGFDMLPTGVTHWHEEHRWETDKERYANVMIPEMEELAAALFPKNINVYNTNINSAVRCFEFCDLKEWI